MFIKTNTITKDAAYQVGDIVTTSSNYGDYRHLDITMPEMQVFYIMSVNTDGTITLAGVWSDIPARYVDAVPIQSELAKRIYYDTNHARPYVPGCVIREDVYSRPPFMEMMAERFGNSRLREEMQKEEFLYVHELQHWLREHLGYSRIGINYFWGMRKPIVH